MTYKTRRSASRPTRVSYTSNACGQGCHRSGAPPGLLMLGLLGAVLFGVAIPTAEAQDSGVTGCAFVLKQGLYNTYKTSTTGSSYAEAMSAFCRYDSSYTQSQYKQDLDNARAGRLEQVSNRFRDVQAGASYGPFSASVGVKTGDSSGSSNSYMEESKFGVYQAYAASMSSSACGKSQSTSASQEAAETLSTVVDPNVIDAYKSCLNLYKSGVQVSSNTGDGAASFTVDIMFKPQGSATAYITNVQVIPAGSATCNISTTQNAPVPFTKPVKLASNAYVAVLCAVVAGKAPASKRSDVYISTDIGGSWHGLLFHSADASEINQLRSSVTTLSSQLSVLSSQQSALSVQVASNTQKLVRLNANGTLTVETVIAKEVRAGSVHFATPDRKAYWFQLVDEGSGLNLKGSQGTKVHTKFGLGADLFRVYLNADGKAPYFNVDSNGVVTAISVDAIRMQVNDNLVVRGNMDANKLQVTHLVVRGDIIMGGTNSWILHTPDDKSLLSIAPGTNEGNWRWDQQVVLQDGTFNNVKLGKVTIWGLDGMLRFVHQNGKWNDMIFDQNKDAIRMGNREGDGYRAIWAGSGKHLSY